MECSFRVGQKVLCVDDTPLKPPAGYTLVSKLAAPIKGTIYTVREIKPGIVSERPCIQVEEIPNQIANVVSSTGEYIVEIIWEASGFRPLVERGTEKGMSILRDLLNKQNQTVREDA